ncbi:hypothetical protein FB565_006604 [Actinoplanes lutulentus]|uniref:Uncharacterized protein n=1 Tax=Actinoplanes lutulentus TaxID=1287878 RepID=A0A327ZBK6_9ACTN|nr:hypothetical protein [Actinoplanes lutulentus]MBB2946836.1 hypothetical protein [Actinoplanes lutulentus]RAK35728.1 hypothetical protein B0I29_109202 [Actinoplanes lutulentus]
MNDQTIKDAFDAIAATAVSPERVRARIDARARAHRQRRLLLAGAGFATVAAAVGVPMALGEGLGELAPPGFSPPPAEVQPVRVRAVSLMYAPTWLPDGVAERFRAVRFTTVNFTALGGSRSWYPEGSPYSVQVPEGSVTFGIGEQAGEGETAEPVKIGSADGTMWVTDTAFVQWQPAGGPWMTVSVYGTGDDASIALRVARSVAATTATALVTMTSPVTPPGYDDGTALFEVYPTSGGGAQSLTFTSSDGRSAYQLSTSPPESGEQFKAVTRNGLTVYLPGEPADAVGGGVPLTDEQTTAILAAANATAPDLSWVG